jgi:hypothetical protein
MITGMPLWSPEEYSTATISWAADRDEVSLERGKFLSWDDYWKHSRSLGKSQTEAREHYDSVTDIRIKLAEKTFFVGAGHFQFSSRRDILQEILPIPSRRPMGEVRLLDSALNEKGYLRLSTQDWWVQHMGNMVDPELAESGSGVIHSTHQGNSGLWSWKPLRKPIKWLNGVTFDILYRSSD